MSEIAIYVIALAASIAGAICSVQIARRRLRPLHRFIQRVEPRRSATVLRPWRVAIDARPMIGHFDGHEYRVFGIGQYLRGLVQEIASQDRATQYVLWSSSWKGKLPDWYREFIAAHENFRAVHLKVPNALVDRAALRYQLRFLHELVGRVDVSYEANYFQIRPGGAYSICSIPDLTFRENRRGLQERAAFKSALADMITTVSDASRERILAEIPGVHSENVEVVYGAADSIFSPETAERTRADVVARYGLPHSYLLCIGEPEARKNIPLVVEAYQRARRELGDLHLVFAGCSYAELRANYPDVDLVGVKAIGYVPRHDLPAIYQAGTALIYPSREEGFGLPVVEAMQTGQVVVVSNDAALLEVGGDAALRVQPNADELAQCVRRVTMMGDAERRRLITAGFERSKRFSWSVSAKKLLILFETGLRSQANARARAGQARRMSGLRDAPAVSARGSVSGVH